ncbi:hypothetical protein Metlim_2200 [Methanoplanus limicola DSM 2279]|uniref:Uncharacterized protein n=1 Tax=Methanoplanus limicola DSM 2279 TaxID=937775 RepID=H1Z0X0_9EURY|nr:hypothetical protein Metlim_2200 [Methanoplanus limicola DSM 2279]
MTIDYIFAPVFFRKPEVIKPGKIKPPLTITDYIITMQEKFFESVNGQIFAKI